MLQLYRFPLSTNVERVALALAHKEIEAESVEIDPGDRGPVRRISGQDLVPVLVHDGRVVHDSMEIIRYLEEAFPARPLYPPDPSRRAEMQVFIDWFNRVWKRPPNDMEAELGRPQPDSERVNKMSRVMRGHLDLFEQMLAGRDFLMGSSFSAADCAAWPFLRYALIHPVDDPYLFHKILMDHQPLGDDHPRLAAWIRRIDERPRA